MKRDEISIKGVCISTGIILFVASFLIFSESVEMLWRSFGYLIIIVWDVILFLIIKSILKENKEK